jgi:predicted dienelactone hydrolase
MVAICIRLVMLALTALAAAVSVQAAETAVTLDGVEAVVWTPDGPVERAPVIVFSHGIALCATQSRYLTQAAARAGYLVVAPQHADRNCITAGEEPGDSEGFAGKPAVLWTDADYRDRRDDVRKVLAAMRADERFRAADFTRIGLVGHSLGGYTVLGLGGAWPSWKLDGVRAIVALSPYVRPYARTSGIAKLKAPVLFEGGTRDVFTPFLQGAYDRAPAPKAYVEFSGASHYAWTDDGPGDGSTRSAMAAWAIAFLDRHVKGSADAAFPDPKSPGLAKVLRAPAR